MIATFYHYFRYCHSLQAQWEFVRFFFLVTVLVCSTLRLVQTFSMYWLDNFLLLYLCNVSFSKSIMWYNNIKLNVKAKNKNLIFLFYIEFDIFEGLRHTSEGETSLFYFMYLSYIRTDSTLLHSTCMIFFLFLFLFTLIRYPFYGLRKF